MGEFQRIRLIIIDENLHQIALRFAGFAVLLLTVDDDVVQKFPHLCRTSSHRW